MNALPPEIEAAGWLAYERARAFESLQRRRLPLVYAGFALLFVVGGITMFCAGHRIMAWGALVLGIVLPLWFWWSWHQFGLRHAENLRLLGELETRYGLALPWLEVERHVAALEKLRGELADEALHDPDSPP